jgi:flavin-dependent dehydrogenase
MADHEVAVIGAGPDGITAAHHLRQKGIPACNPGLSTYFIKSQSDTVYHRPQRIAASRRFARKSQLSDHEFSRAAVPVRAAPTQKAQIA